jgi:16S rRNA (guanine1207-N2)-methyltransferase
MSLANTSQLLIRNIDLLNAKQPLLVNPPNDSLIVEYKKNYPEANLASFTYDYANHLYLKALGQGNINHYFAASYQGDSKHDLAIIFFPKSKNEFSYTLAMLANQLSANAKILVVGENKGGVKSTSKLSQHFLNDCEKIDAARHCSLFLGDFNGDKNNFNLADWYKTYQLQIDSIEITICSLPGVFSQNELDVGTKLLMQNLPAKMQNEVLDFGCGAGVISVFIGKKHPDVSLSLLDVNALALKSAQQTLAINQLQGKVFASDSLSNVAEKYQHIVSNPPFHQGLKTHYASTESFLSQIKAHIKKTGNITIVANSFLRYQAIMEANIGKTNKVLNQQGFCIYSCKV